MTDGHVIWSTSKVDIPTADWFGAGVIKFTSGLNTGVSMEIVGIRKMFEAGKLIYDSSLGDRL